MNNSTHLTYRDLASCPCAVSIFFTTAMVLIISAAFVGNILVIVTVYKTPSLRTSTNYYYVNMAVSDSLSSLTTLHLYLTDEIITSSGSLLQGPLATVGCKLGTCTRGASFAVSTLSLVLIAIDRFIATVFPLKAKFITRKKRTTLIMATWVISTASMYPAFSYSEIKQVDHKIFCLFSSNGNGTKIYLLAATFMLFFAPFIAIVVLYSRIMRALRKRERPESDSKGGNFQQKRYKENQNVLKIFKSIVAAFVVSYFLVIIYVALHSVSPELALKDKCSLLKGFGFFVFPSLSTAINPLILFTFSTTFRRPMQKLCLPLFCKMQDVN